jgi:colanic acid biosynthesis glycosyl transferase WcaI
MPQANPAGSVISDLQFNILYSGNLGLAHRFDAIVTAANILFLKQLAVRFLFVGGGTRLEEVKRGTTGLRNVSFMDYQGRTKLNELYNSADMHLISLRDETTGLQVPSKYAAALAAGKPVLLVGGKGSSIYNEIQAEGIGWVCEHDPEQIVDTIMQAVSRPDIILRMRKHARRVFEKRYDRLICTANWMRLLNAVTGDDLEKIVERFNIESVNISR